MKLEKLNPSVKAATVLIAAVLLSFQYLTALNMVVFTLCLLGLVFFSDASPMRMIKLLVPAFAAAFGLFMMGLYYARGNSLTEVELETLSTMPYAVRAAASQNLTTALQLATRLLAYAGVGILFALTTDGEQFIASLMHQCHLSPKFAYGILAAFHLMPTIADEYRKVHLAFNARGIRTHALSIKPLFTMLVNSIRWSESLAMAMESKGFNGEAERTYYEVPQVHWYDWVFAAVFIGGIIALMIALA